MPDDILIIVPLFNAEMHLHEFCSELQFHAQADILFIDDGSKDDTQIILKQLGYAYLSDRKSVV